MRKLTAGLMFVAMGCAIAADSPETRDGTAWKVPEGVTSWKLPALEPPTTFFPAASPWAARPGAPTPMVLGPEAPAITEVQGLPDAPCYFIRQVNPYLSAPSATPGFVPLASAPGQPSYYRSADCLTAALIRGPSDK